MEAEMTPGQSAYARYGAVTGQKTYAGQQMKAWEDLPGPIQQAWEAAGGSGGAVPFRPGDILVLHTQFALALADQHLLQAQAHNAGFSQVMFLPPAVTGVMALHREQAQSPEIHGLCRAPGGRGELCNALAGHFPATPHSWAEIEPVVTELEPGK